MTKTVAKIPTVEELLASAHEVGQLAEKQAAQAEIDGTIGENVIQLLKDSKITRLMLPKEYGEPQVSLKEFSQIVRTVSSYNISAGWLTYLYPLHNILPAYLPKNTRDEIVQQGGLICDVFAAVGTAEKNEGGYIINGTWNFASGVLYSDWIGLGVAAHVEDSDKKEVIMPIFHKDQVEIVKNWDTFGLRGTGSNQVKVNNVFVPTERILRLDHADKFSRPPEADYDKDYLFYDAPFYATFYLGFPAIALGGAERVLKEFKKLTEQRVRLVDGVRESESPRSQRVFAEMNMQYHAADALMDKYINLLMESRNIPHDEFLRGEFFAIRTSIIKTCTEIAVRALLTLGGAALYKGGPIELFIRDILSVATHKTALFEDSVAAYGQELFGFASGVRG
jgi:alkylation response protein AidB-like acyl-CoA dehydrogenase